MAVLNAVCGPARCPKPVEAAHNLRHRLPNFEQLPSFPIRCRRRWVNTPLQNLNVGRDIPTDHGPRILARLLRDTVVRKSVLDHSALNGLVTHASRVKARALAKFLVEEVGDVGNFLHRQNERGFQLVKTLGHPGVLHHAGQKGIANTTRESRKAEELLNLGGVLPEAFQVPISVDASVVQHEKAQVRKACELAANESDATRLQSFPSRGRKHRKLPQVEEAISNDIDKVCRALPTGSDLDK